MVMRRSKESSSPITKSRKATPSSAGPASASGLETVIALSSGTEETRPPRP
jgi:hypothetical protein